MSASSPKSEPGVSKAPAILKWFYDLPIRHKQLLGLFTSELISVIGLVGVGTFLIIQGGRQQLLQQVKSEMAVTAIEYDLKINQMGFGFRGQSDNAAIIAAARDHAQGRPLNPGLQQQVKEILQNEIRARTIEYATLVGLDLKIIANANADRTGERFNPNNLISEVLANPQQIKTSEQVTWDELVREAPPLPDGLIPQDVLIRYTATPVMDRQTDTVVGVLVSGDIVNGKFPIVRQTVETLNGGYSAIYAQQLSGEFQPVVIFEAEQGEKAIVPIESTTDTFSRSTPPKGLVPGRLSDALLNDAVAKPGVVVTGRDRIGHHTYTIAAKAITNYAGDPIAVLVRGTSETALNSLLSSSLSTQLMITLVAITADIGLAILLGFALIEPTRRLQKTAQQFAKGDLKARAEVFSGDEVGQLTQTFNEMADELVNTFHLEEQVTEQRQLNQQLQQEILERQQAEAKLQESERLLTEKNRLLEKTLQDLQSAQSQMLQSEKMSSLGQLVAGIAHEINNPVNFIHGNLPYIHGYASDLLGLVHQYQQHYPNPADDVRAEEERIDLAFVTEDLPKMVESISVGTHRIRDIVLSLRNFSRMDEAEFKTIDIHEGLDSTLLILRHRLNSKKNGQVQIRVTKEYGELPLVTCYPGQLNQVFMNILVNAIDALEEYGETQLQSQPQTSRPQTNRPQTNRPQTNRPQANQTQECYVGQITIRTTLTASDTVEIAIADNGPGISDDIKPRIFDPFFTTKPVGKGTGMGMSISYQIITENHGGALACISGPEQGTKFVIQIPKHQTPIKN